MKFALNASPCRPGHKKQGAAACLFLPAPHLVQRRPGPAQGPGMPTSSVMLMRGKRKPTPRYERSWVEEQLDGPAPKLTPRERRQAAEWNRRPVLFRAKAQVRCRSVCCMVACIIRGPCGQAQAREIMAVQNEVRALPLNLKQGPYSHVWTKTPRGLKQEWLPKEVYQERKRVALLGVKHEVRAINVLRVPVANTTHKSCPPANPRVPMPRGQPRQAPEPHRVSHVSRVDDGAISPRSGAANELVFGVVRQVSEDLGFPGSPTAVSAADTSSFHRSNGMRHSRFPRCQHDEVQVIEQIVRGAVLEALKVAGRQSPSPATIGADEEQTLIVDARLAAHGIRNEKKEEQSGRSGQHDDDQEEEEEEEEEE